MQVIQSDLPREFSKQLHVSGLCESAVSGRSLSCFPEGWWCPYPLTPVTSLVLALTSLYLWGEPQSTDLAKNWPYKRKRRVVFSYFNRLIQVTTSSKSALAGAGQPAGLSTLALFLATTHLCWIKATVLPGCTQRPFINCLSEVCTKPNANEVTILVYVVTLPPPSTSEATVTWGLLFQVTDCTQIVSAFWLQGAQQGNKMGLNIFSHDSPGYAARFLLICCRKIHVSCLRF